ncbi:MAG: DUF6585 family protein [Nostoc sp.]|uniref:DUF6585 family protein n=1 Tax=Nostoc sp. TaxID=1180 RepID=UPI002FF57D1C
MSQRNHPILGKFVKEFKPKISRELGKIIGITFCLILFSISQFLLGLPQGSVSLILSLVCLIIAGVLAYRIIDILKDRLFLYEKGLVYQSSNKISIISFSDIVALWQYSAKYYLYFIIPTGRTTYEYTIQTKDGNRIILDEIIAKEELGKHLNYELFKHLMPSLKFNYNAGKEVFFGEITISKHGIKTKNVTLPWLEVERIDISAGKLYIRKKNSGWLDKNWYVTEVSTIYNLYIFLEMTNTVLENT